MRNNNTIREGTGGQAMVTLLVFMVIAVTITAAAVTLVINSSRATTSIQEGMLAYYIAESGIENALMRTLRNPSYAGETLSVSGGTAVVTVTPGSPKTILSTAALGNFIKKIQVNVTESGGIMQVISWKETF